MTGWAVSAAGVAAAAATALGYRLTQPDTQLLGHVLVAGRDPRECALTFDDGPNDRTTPAMLEVLARHGVQASFFMIGSFARQRPDLVRQVRAAGHVVGNHTMTHPFLATMLPGRIREEIAGCNRALEDALGEPVRYFRPPHGARRPAVSRICREQGMLAVQWNAQADDWKPLGVEGMLARLDRDLKPLRRSGRGANILLHDGAHAGMGADRDETVRLVERLLSRHDGTRWVTVDRWDTRAGERAGR